MDKNKSCPCPKANCPRHGNCDECRAFHAGKKPPYCQQHQKADSKKN